MVVWLRTTFLRIAYFNLEIGLQVWTCFGFAIVVDFIARPFAVVRQNTHRIVLEKLGDRLGLAFDSLQTLSDLLFTSDVRVSALDGLPISMPQAGRVLSGLFGFVGLVGSDLLLGHCRKVQNVAFAVQAKALLSGHHQRLTADRYAEIHHTVD